MPDLPNTSREFLELLMERPPAADELQQWLNKGIPEDQFLEYKDGMVLDKAKPGEFIREYVAAFANSEGGVLIIGVKDAELTVTGAKTPGGKDLVVCNTLAKLSGL